MCKGRGVPGNSTTSSGNRGIRAAKRSPGERADLRNNDLRKNESVQNQRADPDCTPALDFTSCRGIKARMELAGKIVVVTGASMGIGEAIAKIFADRGSSVVMLSRDAGRVEAARGRVGHGERTLAMACDVRHREDVDRAIGLTLHHFQRIDVWIDRKSTRLNSSHL